MSEGAVDTEGPRREFFWLLAEEVREPVYFSLSTCTRAHYSIYHASLLKGVATYT